jgi:hypothetical protein
MKFLLSYPTERTILIDTVTQKKSNSNLDGNVLYIWDVFTDQDLIKIFKLYGHPKYIIADSNSTYESKLDIKIYCIDFWIKAELSHYQHKWNIPDAKALKTTYSANFLINKKQINRVLLIKFCEIFNIKCGYTWSGLGKNFDLSYIIEEKSKLNNKTIDDVWGQILAPITQFDASWIPYTDQLVNESSVLDYGNNLWTWNNGLDSLVSQTAVSLISESVSTQIASTFTEKTAYAMLGLTFPLWVGGVNMATDWQKKGFDIFEDVIDHNYQSMPTLLERCFYAFELNKEILTNLELAKHLRKTNIDRLIENRNRLLGDSIEKYNQTEVATWPEEIKHIALPLMQKFAK